MSSKCFCKSNVQVNITSSGLHCGYSLFSSLRNAPKRHPTCSKSAFTLSTMVRLSVLANAGYPCGPQATEQNTPPVASQAFSLSTMVRSMPPVKPIFYLPALSVCIYEPVLHKCLCVSLLKSCSQNYRHLTCRRSAFSLSTMVRSSVFANN